MSRLRRSSPFRPKFNRCADIQTSMFAAVFFALAVSQIATNTDGAAVEGAVLRVIRVDVPPLVRAYNAKPNLGEPQPPAPLLLTCAYRLQGGENDREDGEEALTTINATELEELAELKKFTSPEPEVAMDEAILEIQRHRGLVVKWYYRQNPVPNNDPMYTIDRSEQVYQWIAGAGPAAGGPLGILTGHTVDITDQTPRIDKTALHRVIRVDRPTADLTGQYRCQVEDWRAERRSPWFPMIVYTPERVFKVIVNDNDDDDEHDIAEESEESSTTPVAPTTSSTAPPTSAKNMPTEINITCYAAGMNPEPSMSIWVNGVKQDSVTTVIREDDGDDDESNDGIPQNRTTTTTTTTTVKPRFRGRHRETEPFKAYSIRAEKVIALKDVEEYRTGKQQRRRNTVEVECRLRVPGEHHWSFVDKRGRPGRHYSAHKTVSYMYSADQQSPSDAFAAVSSASSVADVGVDGDRRGNDDGDGNEEDAKNTSGFFLHPPYFFVQSLVVVLHLAQAALVIF